jgi:16S rRNA (cytosine1402-N4)-methyltransferase
MVPEDSIGHIPVLKDDVLRLLAPRTGETVVDATIGLAGHARLFAEAIGPTGTLIGVDWDPANLAMAERQLAGSECRVIFVRGNFGQLGELLAPVVADKVDVLFADLGVSSTQLDQAGRGFSFLRDGPLDMRMDPDRRVTAAELVNRLKERELADLLYENSQEPASRTVARRICESRRSGRITTTKSLAAIVADALQVNPDSHKAKGHPATRVFMALRMAVNDEIQNLNRLLEAAPSLLRSGGRFGVIAFHSLEDKPIKLDFRRRKKENVYEIVTAKPVVAEEAERRSNPRSRSAKLRVAVRLPESC